MNRLFRFGYRIGSVILTVPVLLMVFAASACGSTEPIVIERTVVVEVIREVEVTREVEVKVQEIVEVVVTATPTPATAVTPSPVADATPSVNDYFVVLNQGIDLTDDAGVFNYYDRPSGDLVLKGPTDFFYNEKFYLEYLWKEGIITSQQKDDYFEGKPIQNISLVAIATATYELFENDPYNANRLSFLDTEYLLQYADKSSLNSEK